MLHGLMTEGAVARVHCAGELVVCRSSSYVSHVSSCKAAQRQWSDWERQLHSRVGSLSLAKHAGSKVGGDASLSLSKFSTALEIGRSGTCPGCGFAKLRWQPMRVREGSTTAEVQAPGVDELQKQLESLQQEAEGVQYRAHGARARFIRLSEAAEQLRLRAAMDVKAGMDENAVRLLQEKQRVMEALELSKKRASVLDELYAKLNEAISMKETQLIAALSCARLDMSEMEVPSTDGVRVVSSPEQTMEGEVTEAESSPMVTVSEQSPVLPELSDVEGTTDGTSTSTGIELDSSGNLDQSNRESDLAAGASSASGEAGANSQLLVEAENLAETDVATDRRSHTSLESSEESPADEGNGRSEIQPVSPSGTVAAGQEAPLSDSLESVPEEDQQGDDAGAELPLEGMLVEEEAVSTLQDGSDDGGPAIRENVEAPELATIASLPDELVERQIAEFKAELGGLKDSLDRIREFLDLEDTCDGALELQLGNLIKKRDVTRVMIMELFLGSTHNDPPG